MHCTSDLSHQVGKYSMTCRLPSDTNFKNRSLPFGFGLFSQTFRKLLQFQSVLRLLRGIQFTDGSREFRGRLRKREFMCRNPDPFDEFICPSAQIPQKML
ncbi:hypothetical protein RvY_06531-2 [Ramazzottius varieornatus]|uniref:Uncharacterized protein n=1 Tax=Ramazzottius varieornatus TaxID=947166 RepID=A0A1D1V1U4_RAMVA|nr:hypothetical protein RvY_06531-2 [Ramazzottius varieornatus]